MKKLLLLAAVSLFVGMTAMTVRQSRSCPVRAMRSPRRTGRPDRKGVLVRAGRGVNCPSQRTWEEEKA